MRKEFLEKVTEDFPEFKFVRGRKFMWQWPEKIVIGPEEAGDELLLLHELGHAVSGHRDFDTMARRIKMEVEAWERARELAVRYGIEVDEGLIEGGLDSYREWLHTKSRCPACGLTRYQTPDGEFHCPRCESFA